MRLENAIQPPDSIERGLCERQTDLLDGSADREGRARDEVSNDERPATAEPVNVEATRDQGRSGAAKTKRKQEERRTCRPPRRRGR